jgi:3-oxoacyl-[acyl-carrier-protein] synthase-3
MEDSQGRQHWMLYEGGRSRAPTSHTGRFESLGLELPSKRVTSRELLDGALHHPDIDLERLTGIRERRVCSEGEDSFTLAVSAARDCLAHSHYGPSDLDMLVSCSISKNKGGLRHRVEPPLSLSIKEAIGASRAKTFDLSNACSGMITGIFVLNDFIRRGAIQCGMVVSGEYISNLGVNAAKRIRSILSPELASLTLGDAGVAAIVERSPEAGKGIRVIAFTTLSEHSRLCVGGPAKVGPGGAMLTKARAIHRHAVEDSPPLLEDFLDQSGITFGDVDFVIPHQTSKRAIEKGTKALAERLGVAPRSVVENVQFHGNTASTTHFVALYEYLRDGRFRKGETVVLLSFASGLEVGVLIFEMDELVDRYAGSH